MGEKHMTMLHHKIDPKIINATLSADVERLVGALLPAARREGMHLVMGNIQGDAGQSLKINLAGKHRGHWRDFATGEYGDCLALVGVVLGMSFPNALQWALEWLGGNYQSTLAKAPAISHQKQEIDTVSANKNKVRAVEIWKAAKPIHGTLAEKYLREHRGISLNPLPPSLRFHPRLWHKYSKQYFPALVAAIQAPDGTITAVHRIFLCPTTGRKANVSEPKLTLGRMNGGAVRLAAAGETLILCEGLEDALTILQAKGLPVWATCGASGFKSVVLPDVVHTVIIAADRDENETGKKAALAAAQLFTEQKRQVRIATPPAFVKDFNELMSII